MTAIVIKYKLLDKEFEYNLDDKKTFDKHLLAICDAAKCVGLPTNYVLALEGSNTIVQPMDLKKKPPKPKEAFNLILSPKKCREIPSLRDVIQSLADLDSGNANRIKKGAFELMERLKVLTKFQDAAWSETFRIQNGVPLLVKAIEKATGNLLAYSLRALESYIRSIYNLSFIRTTLMNKLLDSIFVSELNVVRPALNILALMTDPLQFEQAKGALLFIKSRRKKIDWSLMVQLLVNSDIGIQIATLTFINHMLNILENFDKADPSNTNTINGNIVKETTPNIVINTTANTSAKAAPSELDEFMTMLCDSIGVLYILEKQTQIESPELRRQISIFQSYFLRHVTKNRGVQFDESRDEHMQLLARFWRACFAGEPFPGVVSERWKEIGFQYKNPLTDLRACGVMGLEHVLFYAETYAQNFQAKVQSQQLKPFEYQYPVCVAGLHISHLLTVDVFRLHELGNAAERRRPPKPDVRLVHPMLLQHEGLVNIYSIIFERLEIDWETKRARYLEFAQVFEQIRTDVAHILTEHGLLDVTKFKLLLLGAEHKDIIHPVIAANNLKQSSIGARLSMQVHPTSFYLELARKSDLFSEAMDIDASPVSSPRRPSTSVMRELPSADSEDTFLKYRLKESAAGVKRVSSLHLQAFADPFINAPNSAPTLTPVTQVGRDKFLLSGANRILSRSARNSAMPSSSTMRKVQFDANLSEVDFSMMETVVYQAPSTTSDEWPSAMPIYLRKKGARNADVNRSTAVEEDSNVNPAKLVRVKSAPDMTASIRKASGLSEADRPVPPQPSLVPRVEPTTEELKPVVEPQVSFAATEIVIESPSLGSARTSEGVTLTADLKHDAPESDTSVKRPTPVREQRAVAPQSVAPKVPLAPVKTPVIPKSPPSSANPRPLNQASKSNAVPTVTDVPERSPTQPLATDSLPVMIGHTLVSRNSLPKRPAPPSGTLRNATSGECNTSVINLPKAAAKNSNPPKVPLTPKPPLTQGPQSPPAPKKGNFAPGPGAGKKFGAPAPEK